MVLIVCLLLPTFRLSVASPFAVVALGPTVYFASTPICLCKCCAIGDGTLCGIGVLVEYAKDVLSGSWVNVLTHGVGLRQGQLQVGMVLPTIAQEKEGQVALLRNLDQPGPLIS